MLSLINTQCMMCGSVIIFNTLLTLLHSEWLKACNEPAQDFVIYPGKTQTSTHICTVSPEPYSVYTQRIEEV